MTTYVRGGDFWHETIKTEKDERTSRRVHATVCGGTVIVGASTQTTTPTPLCGFCAKGVNPRKNKHATT